MTNRLLAGLGYKDNFNLLKYYPEKKIFQFAKNMVLGSMMDAGLLQSWKNGNEKAYAELFNRYFSKLYLYSLRYISDRSVSEEIVMDVMFNVWQKKDIIRIDRSLSGYLFTSVRNRMIDYFRKQTVQTLPFEAMTERQSVNTGADTPLRQKEMECVYHTGVQSLSAQKKKIFTMSREEGCSYREIASRLGLSQNTVENHMVAALRLFRVHIRKAELLCQ